MKRLTPERLDEILVRARELRVAVIGDLMLDVYLSGSVTRISPEAPVPVVHVSEERSALGGAANVAANVAALGADCHLIGYVGRDAAAEEIRGALARQGSGTIRPRLVERDDRPTTTKTRVMARHQQVVRFDRESADDLPDHAAEEIAQLAEAALAEADVVLLEDYNKGVLSEPVIRRVMDAAGRAGLPTVVDPKFRNFHAYGGATVFKPNVLELTAALGGAVHHDDDAWLEEARARLGCEHLLLTLGEHGMALQTKDARCFRIPTVARKVYDVSGAGDTVTACVGVAIAAGASLQEAAILANYAAGIGVGKPGVATVTPDELREGVQRWVQRLS